MAYCKRIEYQGWRNEAVLRDPPERGSGERIANEFLQKYLGISEQEAYEFINKPAEHIDVDGAVMTNEFEKYERVKAMLATIIEEENDG